VAHLNAGPALLRNVTKPAGTHWVTLDLVGSASNRDGIGARVTCKLGNASIVREVCSAGSYCCSHDYRVHVGLGDAGVVDSIEVRWPGGRVQTLEGVKGNQVVTVREPVEEEKKK
jgi:hypothetical protein